MKQLFLIHGHSGARVHEKKNELIDSLVKKEERAESLTEFSPPGNRPLYLSRIAAEVIGELSMVPFFPDSRRVLIVYEPRELYTTRKSRSSGELKEGEKTLEGFLRYLGEELPETPNALIIVVTEDFVKDKQLNTRTKTYKTLKEVGEIHNFSEKEIVWRFEDALLGKNPGEAITVFREWFNPGDNRSVPFYRIQRLIRLLLQAKLVLSKEETLSLDHNLEETLFPDDLTSNLTTMHAYPQKKYKTAARSFSMEHLLAMYEKLGDLNKVVMPMGDDIYVPDIQVVYETFLIEFTTNGK